MEYIYIYIYNLETKEKKFIKLNELSNLFGISIVSLGRPLFVDNNTILYEASDLSDDHHYHFSWNLIENRIKNFISLKYVQSIDIKDSSLLLCNQRALIGILNKSIVPVKDLEILDKNYLKFNNSQLEFKSNTAFVGQSIIYDTTGKNIVNLGSQQFIKGNNLIRINQNLPNGVYVLAIQNGTEQTSYKFIVDR